MTLPPIEEAPCLILHECSCFNQGMGSSWLSLPPVVAPTDPLPPGLVWATPAPLWYMTPPLKTFTLHCYAGKPNCHSFYTDHPGHSSKLP